MKFLKEKVKPHHLHFAHGWLWGVAVFGLAILVTIGIRDGYFRYWFGSDYKIVNAHEVVQSEKEESKLAQVMRTVNIKATVLVGTPFEILYYDGKKGFSGYEKNNEAVLKLQKDSPNRFIAFCTVNPEDANAVSIAEECVKQGAKGFKIYTGHSFFYDKPLNDSSVLPFYKFVEEQGLPLMFHVNSAKYQAEFEEVLKMYSDLKVICPHFCLSSSNLQRLSYLFDNYPNLYSDVSFGDETYLLEGFERISKDSQKYKEFITKYADRFFYGTDIVVTDYEGKNEYWLSKLFQLYRDLLEKDKFLVFLAKDPNKFYNGLGLSYEVLTKIYETNWESLWE